MGGRHGVNTQAHTCTYMHAILPQPPGKATLCSNQIWEIGLATKSLKVNPMVIIGKSKVKACKTLPYTALFHLLSLHPPHYTHYHISPCCQRATGAGLHAALNEMQWLQPSWQEFNALFQDLINCLGIRQYFALFSTLGQLKSPRFHQTGADCRLSDEKAATVLPRGIWHMQTWLPSVITPILHH